MKKISKFSINKLDNTFKWFPGFRLTICQMLLI